jgi:pyruvate kinase
LKGRHGLALPGRTSLPNVRAVLLDTRGPEIRTGKLRHDTSGKETIHLEAGNTLTLQTSDHWGEAGSTDTDLYVNYANVAHCLVAGSKVLLDDGAVICTVQSTNVADGSVTCLIDNSGELRSRAGVNLPGAETDMPAMSDKDKVDIKYGLSIGIDYVAASFIQNAAGVEEIRSYMKHVMENELSKEEGLEHLAKAPTPLIISKIESVSGLLHFDEILQASDGIMVARGDLGVEIPIEQVTNAQKEMVAKCNAVGKPVVVATQMLESMAKNPRPTRAEVADVTNAVYDGADAVMLSGETAKGKYPVDSVKTMNTIISTAEAFAKRRPELCGSLGKPSRGIQLTLKDQVNGSDDDIKWKHLTSAARAAATAAEEQGAAAIVVLTQKGLLPRLISAYRPNVPIIAVCPTVEVARRIILHRGVHPLVALEGLSDSAKPAAAIKDAKAMGFVETGDDIVVVMGEDNEQTDNGVTVRIATVA